MSLIKFYKKYGKPKEGNSRQVFIGKRYVWKIPKNLYGIYDNLAEEKRYKYHNNENIFAKCKLIEFDGFHVLIMEKLNVDVENKPEWSKSVDCQQVGLDHNNNWKVYDFAD